MPDKYLGPRGGDDAPASDATYVGAKEPAVAESLSEAVFPTTDAASQRLPSEVERRLGEYIGYHGMRRVMEESAPTSAALIATMIPGVGEAGWLARLAVALGAGASAQTGVEAERALTHSPLASRNLDQATRKIIWEAGKQGFNQAGGELVGLPFVGGGKGLTQPAEFASKMLGKDVTRGEMADFAAKYGLKMTPIEAAGERRGLSGMIQHLAETSFLGASRAASAERESHMAAQDLVEGIRRTFGPKMSDPEIGELITEKIPEIQDAVMRRFNSEYNAIFYHEGFQPVDMEPARRAALRKAVELRQRILREPSVTDRMKPAMDRLIAFSKGAPTLTPLEIQEARSSLWEVVRDEKNYVPMERKVAKDLAGVLDTAMEDGANKAAPGLGKQWRAVNAEYKAWNETLEKARARQVVKLEEEKVGRFIFQSGDTRLRALDRLMTQYGKLPEGRRAIQTGFLNELLRDADSTGLVNVNTIANSIRKVGPEKIRVVLGTDPAGKQAVENLMMLAQAQQMMPHVFNPSYTAVGLRAATAFRAGVQIISGALWAREGIAAAAISEGVSAGTQGLISHVLFDKTATQAFIRGMRAAESGNMQVMVANLIRSAELIQPNAEIGRLVVDKLHNLFYPSSSVYPKSNQPKPPVPPPNMAAPASAPAMAPTPKPTPFPVSLQ